jgi:hypothetical protein
MSRADWPHLIVHALPSVRYSLSKSAEGRMLELIDESLEKFFRATVPLSATDIDVAFDAPDRDWAAKLTRPTVNLFLWDIRRSSTRSKTGMTTVMRNGAPQHQSAYPVVELRYVVTAWTSDLGDERALLGGLTRSLLSFSGIPRQYCSDALEHLEAPGLSMARAGEDHMDVFKALDGKLKPGLNIVIATQFDTDVSLPTGPEVGTIEPAVGRPQGSVERRRRVAGEIANAADRGAVGAVVRCPGDATTVNDVGQFLLRALPGDEIIVELDPPLVTTVPETGGIRLG